MAAPRKATPAVVQPGEGSPTPAEVYQAALLAGRTEDEAQAAAETRAVELAGGTAAGGLLTLDDVPDDADDAYEWLMRINDLVNVKHPGVGWRTPRERMVMEYEVNLSTGDVREIGPARAPEAWDPEHCPTPRTCFPYLTVEAASASCIHGTTTRES